MSNPDRPIAQPRRRLNRTASTNSVGSVGSVPGSTSPMAHFGFGSPSSATVTGAKPPVQPSFGSPFGAPAAPSTTPNVGFNSGFQQPPSTSLGFGSNINPPATGAPGPSMGFGGFGSPAVPSTTPASTSTTTTAPTFGGGFGMNTNSSPFGGASNIPTSASGGIGGFQSGFGNTSGSLFGGFGKPAQPQQPAKAMDENDSNMDSDEQPPATSVATPSFSGFGSSKPPTSTPAPASPFVGFSFGKPAATPSALTSQPSASTATPLPFSVGAPKDADKSKPSTAGFGFGSSFNTTPTTSTMPFGAIKTTAAEEGKSTNPSAPSPFAGFGNPIPSARITEIHSPEGSGNEKDDSASSKPTEIVPAPKFSLTTTTTAKEAAGKPSIMSFGSFTSTPTEKNNEESTTSSTVKKTEIPPTFAGLKSASEISSPSSVIANTSSPAPTVNTFESATSSTAIDKEKETTTTTSATGKKKDSNAAEKEIAPTSSLFGQQRRNSVTSTTSDTSTQAVAAASPSPFASVTSTTKETDKSTTTTAKTSSETNKPAFSGFGKSANTSSEGFSITPGPSSFFGKPAENKTSDTVVIEDDEEDTAEKNDGKKQAFSFGKPSTPATASAPSFSFSQPAKTTDKPSPFAGFSFSSTSTTSDKPAPTTAFSFGTSTTSDKPAASKSFSFNSPAAQSTSEKPSSFSFSTPATTSTDKPAAPTFNFNAPATSSSTDSRKKRDRDSEDEDDHDEEQSHKKNFSVKPKATTSSPFSFNAPGSKDASPFKFGPTPSDKPSPFSFSTPATTSTDKPAAPTFSFNAPATSSSTDSRKKRDRDSEDEDDHDEEQSHKKSFSAKPKATTSSPFSFDAPGSKYASAFKFGPTPIKKSDAEGSKEPTVVPTFTFGATPAAAATSTPSKETTEKKAFSSDSPAATLKKTFNLGAPPVSETTDSTSKDKSTTDASNNSSGKPPVFSFGSTPAVGTSSPSPFGSDKSSSAAADKKKDTTPTTSKILDTSKAGGKEGEGEKSASAPSGPSITKRVSFSLPDASSSSSPFGSTLPTTAKPSEPASVSLAFSKVKGADDVTKPATLNLLPSAKKDTSSPGVALQTTLKSNITDINQITYKTRFWELPDEARNELALLAHFITEQTDKKEKIDQVVGSYFGSALKEVHTNAINVNEDAVILGEKLEIQSKAIDDLILLNKEQRLNAASASNVQQQDSKNWRMRGASENWSFFNHAITNMEERMDQLSETVSTIEQAVNSFQPNVEFSPQHIGAMLGHQSKMYMSLAGRVAEIHQEADRVIKRRKLTK